MKLLNHYLLGVVHLAYEAAQPLGATLRCVLRVRCYRCVIYVYYLFFILTIGFSLQLLGQVVVTGVFASPPRRLPSLLIRECEFLIFDRAEKTGTPFEVAGYL